jgi:hypothetical protein
MFEVQLEAHEEEAQDKECCFNRWQCSKEPRGLGMTGIFEGLGMAELL